MRERGGRAQHEFFIFDAGGETIEDAGDLAIDSDTTA